MLYSCRCGNFRVHVAETYQGTPSKSEWLAVPSAETHISWKFLSLNVTRQVTNGTRCKYFYCVLCSAWVIGERSDNAVLMNKQYFHALSTDEMSDSNTLLEQYRFLSPEYASDSFNASEGAAKDIQAEASALKAVGSRYLEDEREKTAFRIAQYEREEWAKFESAKADCERQLEALEKSLQDAYDAVTSLGLNALPSETALSAASLLSPDDGFAQTEDDDPPREWRDVAPRSSDLTEADVFELGSSDESGNDLGLPLSGIPESSRDSSFEADARQNDIAKPDRTLPSNEGRSAAVPLPVTSTIASSDARFMLSRSQPRAIPTAHMHFGRTAPNAYVLDEENTGEDDKNVANTIRLLARSIVADGTELFVPSGLQDYEEVGS